LQILKKIVGLINILWKINYWSKSGHTATLASGSAGRGCDRQ